MKKIISIFIVCFLVNILNAKESDPIATLTMSIGDVFVKRVMQKEWSNGHIGLSVYSGDRLITKESGKVEVTFNDGSIVFLGNDSEIEFIDQNEEKSKNSLFLFFGELKNKVQKGTRYEVETVHALATVKGTEFEVVSDENQMDVVVYSGAVMVQNEFGKQRVTKGKSSSVTSRSKPSIKRVSRKELKSFKLNDIQPKYFIELFPPSNLHQNQWNLFSGSVKDAYDNYMSDTFSITINSLGNIEFSENGKQSFNKLILEVNQGRFEFYAKSNEETGVITLVSEVVETVSTYLDFEPEETQKRVFIQFNDESGNLKKAEVIFEKNN